MVSKVKWVTRNYAYGLNSPVFVHYKQKDSKVFKAVRSVKGSGAQRSSDNEAYSSRKHPKARKQEMSTFKVLLGS